MKFGRISNLSVHWKLTLLSAVSMSLALLVACAVLLYFDVRRQSASKIEQLSALAEVLAANSTAALSFGAPESAKDLLDSLRDRPLIVSACLVDEFDELFAEYTRDEGEFRFDVGGIREGHEYTADGHLDLVVGVYDGDEKLGLLYVREETQDLSDALETHLIVTCIVLLLSIVFGMTVSAPVQHSISEPILNLAFTLQRFAGSQDYSLRVEHEADNEIGVLYREFNNMLDHIQLRDEKIQRAHDELQLLNQQLEQRVKSRTTLLEQSNTALQQEMREKDSANEELRRTQAELIETSRKAGMADVANGVLHNIGNVLNSLNVSATFIRDRVRKSKVENFRKCVQLLEAHSDDLATFLNESEKGKMLPTYMSQLATAVSNDQDTVLSELDQLLSNVEHIKDVVRAQQSHAGQYGVVEQGDPSEIFEESLKFVGDSLVRQQITVVREFDFSEPVDLQKSKVLQILVNLIKNAKESVLMQDRSKLQITLRIVEHGADNFIFEVQDTGVGIAREKLTTIFSHGFTTKPDGHGFGLHASANAAKEMGGTLTAKSEGEGKGATFRLRLPKSHTKSSKRKEGVVLPSSSAPSVNVSSPVSA